MRFLHFILSGSVLDGHSFIVPLNQADGVAD